MTIQSKQPVVGGYLALWHLAASGIDYLFEGGMTAQAVPPAILLAISTVVAVWSAASDWDDGPDEEGLRPPGEEQP